MEVEIRAKGFSVTDAIRQRAERRLRFALDRFCNVRHVTLCIGDLNGPRGGSDKFCRIAAELDSATAVVEEVQPDLYVAIDRAAHRLAVKVARELGRTYRFAPVRSRNAYGGAA
jgi:ribosome-associated translation inhibitor RaiA